MVLRLLCAFVAFTAAKAKADRYFPPVAKMIIKCSGCHNSVAYGPTLPKDCSYCGTPIPPHLLARNKPTVNVAPKQDKKGELTAHDRRFLRSLRISQDVDPLS